MIKLVYGVGVNDSNYQAHKTVKNKRFVCPYYSSWANMLKRCYSSSYKNLYKTYEKCSVTKEWRSFMAFKSWMEKQDWEGKCLDKDILVPGNKIYSPETCLFVPEAINNLFTDKSSIKGDFPFGVCAGHKGKFRAQINYNGRRKSLGTYDTPEKASEVYIKAKTIIIIFSAIRQNENILINALISRAILLQNHN